MGAHMHSLSRYIFAPQVSLSLGSGGHRVDDICNILL